MKKKDDNYVVLLAGGQGSRFWPESRPLKPKQFLSLDRGETLFRQSLNRVIKLVPTDNIYIAASSLHKDIVRKEASLFRIPDANLIFELAPKNTAPAIALAIKLISGRCRDEDSGVAVLPCDYLIRNSAKFASLMKLALKSCKDHIIIFGIPPHRPATGYGYIKVHAGAGAIRKVSRFCEKPDLKTAKRFLREGNYLWNGGIFVGSIGQFKVSFKRYQPLLFRQIFLGRKTRVTAAFWNKIKPISFDYGVLEKNKNLRVIRASSLGWSDLGSWQAWDELQEKDESKNLLLGNVVNIGSRNTTILSDKRLIAAIGLEGLIIVDTPDALLIADKTRSEEVKKVVLFANRPEVVCTHKAKSKEI